MIVIIIKMSYRFGWLRERSRSPIRRPQNHSNNLPATFPTQKFHNDLPESKLFKEIRSTESKDSPFQAPCKQLLEMRNHQEVNLPAKQLCYEEWRIPTACPSPSQSTDTACHSPSQSLDCEDNLIWSGFLSRSKKYKVGVDANLLKGCFELPSSVYHLDIPFRSPFPVNKKPIALLRLESSNNTQDDLFKTYIEYFSNKHRAGYAPLGKQGIYIIPYGNFAKSLYPNIEQNQMLGFVVDASTMEDVE
ncbi:unnamed protein product [Blepharisma stoltei]|uniref:Spen paralogue and orthologue SPOC C-terminal domain-containing protein n=1 Tax=Blepharisma stoltei TaxID=1481888 RepID=A0AAU9IQM6_9CILI|nr:unnamed protein product [Blepharisma stoltei]